MADVLPKVNAADMAEMMESFKEYLTSSWCCKRLLAYVIRKTTILQICGDYPKYVTTGDEMIARILYLTPDKNRLNNEQSAQPIKEHTAEYKIDNRSVYDIFDQICKDTDPYPYVK